jgi:hypothetical protein
MPGEAVLALISSWSGELGGQPLIVKSTKFVSAEVFLTNDDIPRGLVTQLQVHFMFSRGGDVYTEVDLHTFVKQGSLRAWGVFGLWLILLASFTISTPLKALASLRSGVFMSHMLRFSVLIEWGILVQGWLIVGMLALERIDITTFSGRWETYWQERQSVELQRLMKFDEDQTRQLFGGFDRLQAVETWARVFVADYHLVLLMRLLLATRGQPRLAILVNTISEGLTDLGHLCVVFALILPAFVMTGHIIFGSTMEEFATFKGSFGYVAQIVFQREYQWDDLVVSADALIVWLWVWSLVILVVLVIMSIVLAMIFDQYGQVRNTVCAEDTLWNTAQRLLIQLKEQSDWWSGHDLLLQISTLDQDEAVDASKLKDICHGIPHKQVKMLLEAADKKLERAAVFRPDRTLLPQATATILIGVNELRAAVRLLREPLGNVARKERSSTANSGPAFKPAGDVGEDPTMQMSLDKDVKESEDPQARNAATLLESRPPKQQKASSAGSVPVETAPPKSEPTGQVPLWAQEGLLKFLRQQPARLDAMYKEMAEIQEHLEREGLISTDDLD